MIERFHTSLYQLIGGMGSSSIGMAITTETNDIYWIWIGRIALVIGLVASIVALLNGLKVLCDNISTKLKNMKMKSLFKAIAGWICEVRARAKAETPKFFATMGRFFIIVALASLASIVADKQVSLNLPDLFRQVLSYIFVGALVGSVICKLSVKNTDELYRMLDEKLKP